MFFVVVFPASAGFFVEKMKEFETRQFVLDKEKITWPQIVFWGAHIDDDAMFGLIGSLEEVGIGVTIATLTNSDARGLTNYTPEELRERRWEVEAKAAGEEAHVAEIRMLAAPDSKLHLYEQDGKRFVHNVIEDIDPIAHVTTNSNDTHSDHAAAARIVRSVVGTRKNISMTDTITGLSKTGTVLLPDYFFPLTEVLADRRIRTYRKNTSQVTNIPPEQMRDVQRVIKMTERRGREIGVPHAAVLFDTRNTNSNPIREFVRPQIIYSAKKSRMPLAV